MDSAKTDEPYRWLAPLAQILTVTAMALVVVFVSQQVFVGRFPWWPYLLFTLFTGFVFWGYEILSHSKMRQKGL